MSKNRFFIVTRHSGAGDWLRSHPILSSAPNAEIHIWAHAKPEDIANLKEGDAVIGTLPVGIAADICATGAKFYSLDLPKIPPEWRGRELNAIEMELAGAVIFQYHITRM